MSTASSSLALVLALASAAAARAPDNDMLPWHDTYAAAIAEARATGKPIFLEFRCVP